MTPRTFAFLSSLVIGTTSTALLFSLGTVRAETPAEQAKCEYEGRSYAAGETLCIGGVVHTCDAKRGDWLATEESCKR